MKLFEDKPIGKKLMTGMLITSSVVLLMSCAIYFVYEYVAFERNLIDQTTILAEMCAANSTAALAFQNSKDARAVLSTLKVDPNIISATLFDANDSVFATYPDSAAASEPPVLPLSPGFHFHGLRLDGFIPVIHEGRKLGTLYIVSNMKPLYSRFKLYALIVACVIVFSLIVSYLLSRIIQRNISRSILSLAATAEVVSTGRDYTIRATKYDNDEIGTLTTAFNNMLSEIEKQNHQITSFSQNLEAQVKARTHELERAYDEMEAFSYTVSHDLNAPLRKIDTFIDLYLTRSEAAIDAEGKKTFEKVRDNTRKMRELIADLLAFSQLGKKELVKTEVHMKDLVQSIFEDQKKMEEDRNIEFVLSDIPNAYVDSVTISQVWVNLISNALKYTRRNEVTRIEVWHRDAGSSIIYYIRDNGVGFDMKDYGRLFSAFQRLHSEREFSGTGVGLAIVHRIITKHGGKVWAESSAGHGATFYFSLPKAGQ